MAIDPVGVSNAQAYAAVTGTFAQLVGLTDDVLAVHVDGNGVEQVGPPVLEGRPVVGAFLRAGVVEVLAAVLDVKGAGRGRGWFLPGRADHGVEHPVLAGLHVDALLGDGDLEVGVLIFL